MPSSSSVFRSFEGGALLFLHDFLLLREFLVCSGDVSSQLPSVIELQVADLASVHVSIDGFCEEAYTLFLQILCEFDIELLAFADEFEADFFVDEIGESDDSFYFVEDFFFE